MDNTLRRSSSGLLDCLVAEREASSRLFRVNSGSLVPRQYIHPQCPLNLNALFWVSSSHQLVSLTGDSKFLLLLLINFRNRSTWQESMPYFWRLNDGDRGSTPEELFRQIPPVSKFIICTMVATMISPFVGIEPTHFYMIWSLVWNKFHIWRLVTCFLYPGYPSFRALFHVYVAGMFSIR